jgi:hypothetical protein
MADEVKPADTKAVETKPDYIGAVRTIVKDMRLDAQLFDNSFLPHYNYNNSTLKDSFTTLSNLQTAGVPDAIKDQVTQLEATFRGVVSSILKGDFKKENFENPLTAIEQSIAAAKAKTPPDPAQSNADLDAINKEIVKLKVQALDNELKKMHENLKLQNELDSAKAFTRRAMNEGPYAGNHAMFMANDWVNETGSNDFNDQNFKDANVVLTREARLRKGDDGVYSRPDSYYKVSKRTDQDGNVHYKATYSRHPVGNFQEAGEAFLKTAVMLTRIIGTGTGVIPALEVVSCCLALIGWTLTAGKFTPPYSIPGSQFLHLDKGIVEVREGNIRDTVKAEIDVARYRGREREMYIGLGNSQEKEINVYDLERVVVYLDEMKKRAGYVPGADGAPGTISKPQDAMGFRVGTDFHDKLSALAATKHLTDETREMVKSFYRSQHNGSMAGFKEANFKEIVLKELENYSYAKAVLDASYTEKNKAANTSTITTGEAPTSTLTTGASGPSSTLTVPSAPPLELTEEQVRNRQIVMDSARNNTFGITGTTYEEVTQSAIQKFNELVTATFDEDHNQKPTADNQDVEFCEGLKQTVDFAVANLTEGEKVSLEENGTLEVYTAATIRMTGRDPGQSPLGQLQAGGHDEPEQPTPTPGGGMRNR